MSLNSFIPVVWSARLLEQLHKALVFGQEGVINRDYEGDIAEAGDTVRIHAIGPVNVTTYTKNTNLSDPDTLTDAETTLVIDQSKAFNFAIDDIDKRQQNPKLMNSAMREAAYALANVADQFIAGMYTQVDSANQKGSDASPISVGLGGSDSAAYETLVDLGVLLDNQNIPSEGRWVIVPPWYHGLLQKDNRFVNYGTATNVETLRNGIIGAAAGFSILKSNNVNNDGIKWHIMAGHQMGITYADQISEVFAYRPEKRFGDALKGLHLYGAKMVRTNAVALLTASRGTGA